MAPAESETRAHHTLGQVARPLNETRREPHDLVQQRRSKGVAYMTDPKTQADTFRDMARELECDEDKAASEAAANLIARLAEAKRHGPQSRTNRLILAAGMPRSGSTWLYNALRLLLGDDPDLVAGWVDDVAGRQAAILLVKVHDPYDLAERTDLIFTTYRPLPDVAASLGRMGWPNDMTAMQRVKAQREFWAPRSNCDIAYSDIVESPAETVSRIAGVLGVANKNIAGQLLTMKEPATGYDPVNLLHHGHRTT
jgi:hypothetical protein